MVADGGLTIPRPIIMCGLGSSKVPFKQNMGSSGDSGW